MGSLKARIDKLESKIDGKPVGPAAMAIRELSKRRKEEGRALKAWREKHGYSEEEAAKELGVEHDPLRPYTHGSYRPMESGEGTTNSVRAVIGIQPIEPWNAEDKISFRNEMRQRDISRGVDANPLSAEQEEVIRKIYAKEMREYETAMKLWEKNNDGKH